jgi:hypothetical protein
MAAHPGATAAHSGGVKAHKMDPLSVYRPVVVQILNTLMMIRILIALK